MGLPREYEEHRTVLSIISPFNEYAMKFFLFSLLTLCTTTGVPLIKYQLLSGSLVCNGQVCYNSEVLWCSFNIEDVSSVAAPVLQRIPASDHFGTTGNQWNGFGLAFCKNRRKSCTGIVKVLQLFKLNFWPMRKKLRTFLGYTERTRPIDRIEQELNFVCPRWSTGDKLQYTQKQPNALSGPTLSRIEA